MQQIKSSQSLSESVSDAQRQLTVATSAMITGHTRSVLPATSLNCLMVPLVLVSAAGDQKPADTLDSCYTHTVINHLLVSQLAVSGA